MPSWTPQTTLMDGAAYWLDEETGQVSWDDPAAAVDGSDASEWTWVPHPADFWQPAKRVGTRDDGSVECATEAGETVVVPKNGVMQDAWTAGRVQPVPLWPLKRRELDHQEDDLIMLDNVNDGAIIYNLKVHYAKKSLYTWVGASHRVLASINPYQKLPLYGDDLVQKHREKSPNVDVPPHIFDIANDSYDEMLFEGKNQSILISGESGAGKTEATKQCLKFWAKVAGSKNGVEERLIQANPVLEAFGNAKTIRNNNSSRFGKWIEVYFHVLERSIDGALIINYLLEKSRLVFQQQGERNFHIFYQLLSDADARAAYELQPATENRYTQRGLTGKVDGIDDASDFRDVKQALGDLDFTDQEREWVLRVPAAILHLGNVTFEPVDLANGVRGSKIANNAPLTLAAKFLDVSVEDLRKVLLTRSITVKGETSTIPLDPPAARFGCDSISKGVYSRFFDWLIARCNQALKGDTSGKFVGVLDIFGFEIFDVNSFEQLCINYCNEKLQQLFNIETFRDEEALYQSEGIPFDHIKFIDSEPVLNMIEAGPKGILPLLDDECKLPEGDDHKYMNKVEDAWQNHANFATDKHRKLNNKLAFEVVHYAGTVCYTSDEFMTKNKDTFFQDAYDALGRSAHPLTKALFPQQDTRLQIKSLSSVFRQQLGVLMNKLNSTSTRYVRCIKPNETMSPLLFEAPLVMRQLRYSGVFEAVAIRRQGYPFRFTYEAFAFRFRCVNPDHEYTSTDPRKLVEEIVKVCPTELEVTYGKSRVFYRSATYRLLKLVRNLALEVYIPRVQAVLRRAAARTMRARLTQSEKQLQAALDAVTDYDQLKRAVQSVDAVLGSLGARSFAGQRPRNEEQAKAHLADLQQWKDHEAVMEGVLKTDPNTNYHKYWAALEAAQALGGIPKSAKQAQLVAQVESAIDNCEVGKLDKRAVQARKHVRRADMQECVAQAAGFSHESRPIDECKRVLALPEHEFLELQLAAAQEEGDADRERLIRVRLWQLDFGDLPRAYADWPSWSGFVSGDDYTKGWSFGKNEMRAGMFYANSKPVNRALTVGMDQAAAKAICKGLLVGLGLKADKAGEQLTCDSLQLAARSREGRNELYGQVLKWTRTQPGAKERVAPAVHDKAFDLLLVLLYVAPPPDEEFFKFVFTFAKQQRGEAAVLAATHGKFYSNGRFPATPGELAAALSAAKTAAPAPPPA